MHQNYPVPADLSLIPRDRFQTESLPAEERFSVWRESVLPLFDSFPDESHALPGGFQAKVDSFDLGNMFFGMSAFSALRFRRERRHHEGADHLLVQQYLEGGYVGHNGHRRMRVQPGDISLIDLGRPLETRAVASNVLSLIIPRDLLFAFVKPQALSVGTVIKATSPMGKILGNHLQSVWRNLPSASVQELEAINRVLLGTVVGAFGNGGLSAPENARIVEGVTLEAMQAYIRENLHLPTLSPHHICQHFGCSRARLYRLFAPLGGVAGYIRDCRLARCLEELSRSFNGDQRVVDVAFRWGFSSQSHFCRLFKQTYGISPSEAQERGRQSAGHTGPVIQGGDINIPRFHEWLRHLSSRL